MKSSLELHRGSTSSAVEEIRQRINDLKCPDVEEIKGLVDSFIDEKFIEAYNKMDDETNEENYIDVDLEDNSDDNNYEIQIKDSEEKRETDRERLLGGWILVPRIMKPRSKTVRNGGKLIEQDCGQSEVEGGSL